MDLIMMLSFTLCRPVHTQYGTCRSDRHAVVSFSVYSDSLNAAGLLRAIGQSRKILVEWMG
jgi:hypothetical protein